MSDEFDPDLDMEDAEIEIGDLVDDARKGRSRETFKENSTLPLKRFGLTSHPFADSVNPEFFFRTEAHEEAFLQMKRCIEDNVSLGLTTAISGTGKTLLTQVLMQELDPRSHQTILVLAYPGMSRTALLREILIELRIGEVPERAKIHDLISRIQKHIIEQYKRGVRLVVIIDEVHFLQADSLHILRTLSNIETAEAKLVTVLLFGEQVFLTKMKNPAFRSIFSRMFVRAEIRPLRMEEMMQYIRFRLLMSGGAPGLIAEDAMGPLLRNSGGIPREVNRILHNAMGLAARDGRASVTGDVIERVPAALPIDRG